MKLNVKATAISAALGWGILVMFLTGILNWASGYGQAWLDAVASLYPGYSAEASLGQVIIGTLYGLADGAIVGALFASLYNTVIGRRRPA